MATSKNSSKPPIIRLAHPQVFVSFLDKVGTPTQRLLVRQGLPVYCDDPKALVPLKRGWALFDAAARLEDPFLGWNVGAFFGDNGLNRDLLKQIEGAPTLYLALNKLLGLVSAEASHLELGILERPDEIVFYTRYSNSTIKDWPGYSISQAYQLEAYVDLIRHYAGPGWVPREIGIEHPTVPAVAREHFPGARIRANQPMGYLTIPRSCLHLPALAGTVEQGGSKQLVLTKDFDFVETLRALLEPHLSDGYPSQRLAASLMDSSVRTLERRLSESRISYRSLIDQLRLEAAKKHLLNPALRIIDVAGAVGFAEPANFTRMFRRLAGLTPRQFRRAVPGLQDASCISPTAAPQARSSWSSAKAMSSS